LPPDLDLNYAFGHNFHNKATEKALVDAEQLKDDAANKVKETVVELGRAIRQTRSDSIKPIADYEGESDGHFFNSVPRRKQNVGARAACYICRAR